MANGFHGTKEEWERVEAPFLKLDERLEAFSQKCNIRLKRNGRWPDRSFIWGDPVRKLIQIYVADEAKLTFNFWICASEDRDGNRYWKRDFLKQEVSMEEIDAELPDLLDRGVTLLESWKSENLEFATKLAQSR